STYSESEVDLVAIYCHELRRCYLMPVTLVAGQGNVHLRLEPAMNNQQAALNWAADYEFPGAIAQLEERLTGSQEVVGSIPTTSAYPMSDLKDRVGMDEFYAKLAHYVRRAESGEETLVTRWGKPVARLGPALKPLAVAADE